MSFWDNLGASVGIGACELKVRLETPEVGWQERATGTVRLTGGRIPQEITELKASLVEHWTTVVMVGKTATTQHHYRTHDEGGLAAELTIAPGQEREYPVTLTAPWGGQFSHHWFVGVRASISGAVDRHAACDFKLVPPPAFMRAAAVLSEVSRLPVGGWSLHGQGVRFEFRARGAVNQVLDGVRLELALDGESINGQTVVNPQEHSVGEVLRSLVRADRSVIPVRFLVGDMDSARAAFEAALRPHLDALRQFPIPASVHAATSEDLPRPVSEPAP